MRRFYRRLILNKMSRRKINWSDLPPELLSQIATRLDTCPDILHYRAVCKDWYRSVSLSLLSNKKVLSPILPHKFNENIDEIFEGMSDDTLVLVASSIFKIKPVNNHLERNDLRPWLVTVMEVNQGKLSLKKPFSRSDIVDEPDWFPEMLDLSRFEVEEMAKFYSLRFYEKPGNLFKFENSIADNKVLLIVGSDCETVDTIRDCMAVVLYDNGSLSVITLKDESVRQLGGKVRKFDDIVMFKGTVYVIDRYGKLYWIDVGSSDRLKLVIVVETQLKSGSERTSRLVESCGELYLVRKCMVTKPSVPGKYVVIRVYKLNREVKTWDEVDSIGDDRILFVTPDCCFFARACDFTRWKGNCVVYHEKRSFPAYYVRPSTFEYTDDYHGFFFGRDDNKLGIEVYHFKTGGIESAQYCFAYSVVFWPPPKWVSLDAPSLEGGIVGLT